MAAIQCKMCGGMVELPQGVTSGECPYCGTLTTFPMVSGEQHEQLYNRAEHFRRMNDYDKAAAAYEKMIDADPDDPESYWGLVLCRYGIEYVKDPATGERIPTCHRLSYDSILGDGDYLTALEKAGSAERGIYEAEAKRIAEIQKGILAISSQEEPFDVFLCYKESDDSGKRTRDSVMAQEIYYALTEQGYKVFFARITLEGKLGQQYEPYIFAALNSAKAMLVIGSKPEYFSAVWVRNEWSRFLALMKKDRKKLLIPCYRDMDAYDIPEELSMFQAQDMGKIGFIQDLLHGIAKVAKVGKTDRTAAPAAPAAGGKNPLLRRAQLFVETGDFSTALDFCEKVLNTEPENGEAYFCRLMAELQLSDEAKLVDVDGLEDNKTFKLAQRFADDALKSKLEVILRAREAERRRREEEAEAERRRREEEAEAERRRQEQLREIRQTSEMREEQLTRAMNAEGTLHGCSKLYHELSNCRGMEHALMPFPQLSLEHALAVKTATEEVLAQVGDLAELERLAEEKQRRDRAKFKKIALIVAGAVALLIVIVTSCNAISERVYINTQLKQARAAKDALQWSEVLAHTENVLRKAPDNAEALRLQEEALPEANKRLEEELQKSLPGGVLRLSGDVKLAMVKVEAGTFTMGSRDFQDTSPHLVTLTRDFYLGRTEVTQAQWKAVMGNDPSHFKGDDLPVEKVSWNDAMEFCDRLNRSGMAPKGWKFTLPTEAQWEYAARGGKRSRGYTYSGNDGPDEVAWYFSNSRAAKDGSGRKTHPVATKGANELGLYDMSGNVEEWCLDWYGPYRGDAQDPTGPASGSERVCRGGDWDHDDRDCRSARRDYCDPGHRGDDHGLHRGLGFRLALVPVQ